MYAWVREGRTPDLATQDVGRVNIYQGSLCMTCPKCSASMVKVSFEGIEVDRCTRCHGFWFDAREQEHLRDKRGSAKIDLGQPGSAGKDYNTVRKIDCPVCHSPMIAMTDPGQSHIQFESCTVCYGVFFDAGEYRDYQHKSILESVRRFWKRRGGGDSTLRGDNPSPGAG